MGCFNGTCGLTQLPILYQERIVLVLLVKRCKDIHGAGFSYPDDIYRPYALPIRGEYDDYGGIEKIDASCAHVFDYILNQIAAGHLVCSSVPSSFAEFLTSIHRGEAHATVLGRDVIELGAIMFHEEAFDKLIENIGARKPYNKLYTVKQDYEARFDKLIQDRSSCEETIQGHLIHNYKENILSKYGLANNFNFILDKYISNQDPNIKDGVIDLMLASTALSLARKAWVPQSGAGSQAMEFRIHEILADFIMDKVINFRTGNYFDNPDNPIDYTEETLWSHDSPLDVKEEKNV